MELILIANTVIFGCLALLWSKNTGLNFCIKVVLLTLTVLNGIQAYHVSEANRIERSQNATH